MIDSTSTTCRPARFNERTVRAVARRVGWYIVVACAGTIAFARDFGWPNPGLAYWLFLWFVGWLSNTLAITEWTIAGHELSSRRWFSWPSSKASKIMDLGPDVEAVHETRHRWRVWPNSIVVEPWRAGRLVEAMEQADVRINDWRAGWTRRHQLLNAVGMLAYYGGAVAIFFALALLPRPGSVTGAFLAPVAAVVLCLAAFALGLAIEYLPWSMRKPSAQDV